jgi:hypothetical protein
MEIRKIICKSGNEYSIVNDSWSNSTGWGHTSTLLKGTCVELNQTKIKYLNRTWEMYTYQSCMYRVVEEYKERLLSNYIERYKEKNNVVRFKNGEKQKVIEEFNKTDDGMDLVEIRDRIANRNFD